MKLSFEKLPAHRTKCIAVISAEQRAQLETKALTHFAQKVRIAGFRPGKAPPAMVKSRIDPQDLLQETVRAVLPQILKQAVSEQKIETILQPSVRIASTEPLTIHVTFVEKPTVKLAKAAAISVEKKHAKIVGPKEIEDFIGKILQQDATDVSVDRPSKAGDVMKVDIRAVLDGKEVPELTAPNVRLSVGKEELLPDAEKHLAGMNKDDQRTVTVSFPKAYPLPALRGKTAELTLKAREIAEQKIPELTPEFIKNRFKTDQSPQQIKTEVETMLRRQREQEEKRRREDEFMKKVREQTKVELAPELIDAEIQSAFGRFLDRLSQQQLSFEQWLKATGRTQEQVVTEMRGDAIERLTLRFGLDELVKDKVIEVSELEIDKALKDHTHHDHDESGEQSLRERAAWELKLQKLVKMYVD